MYRLACLSVAWLPLALLGCDGPQPPENYPTFFVGTVYHDIQWDDGTTSYFDDQGIALSPDPSVPRRWTVSLGVCDAVPIAPSGAGADAYGVVELQIADGVTCAWTTESGVSVNASVTRADASWGPRTFVILVNAGISTSETPTRTGLLLIEGLGQY